MRVSTDPTFSFTTEEELFSGIFVIPNNRNFDIMPDPERFVAIFLPGVAANQNEQSDSDHINIVLNWTRELLERLPVA